jgi:hypothetical protein
MKEYDVIIVGAGIAGLYAAYKIKTLSPKITFKILEASPRKWIGGRAGEMNFRGTSVVTGAGIGRKMKDKLLIQLLHDLKIEYSEFPIHHRFSKELQGECNVKKVFEHLKSKHPKQSIGKTFKEYAEPILGKDGYSLFVICSGYSDYEKEDSYDTLYHYEFDDNFSDGVGLSISWPKLIDSLVEKIGSHNIITSCRVTKLLEYLDPDYCELSCENGKHFFAKKVILAATIDSVKKLLPKDRIYNDIGGQVFLRLYGKFSKDSIPLMQEAVPGFTIVRGPLQKIIPMDSKEGIYMIAYSDNKSAKQLQKYLKNTAENREYISHLLEKALNIPKGELHMTSILDAYWEIGTHYYKPLAPGFKTREEFIEDAQHPRDNILVIGEMVALNQGWVEGALDSVKRVLTKSWLEKA